MTVRPSPVLPGWWLVLGLFVSGLRPSDFLGVVTLAASCVVHFMTCTVGFVPSRCCATRVLRLWEGLGGPLYCGLRGRCGVVESACAEGVPPLRRCRHSSAFVDWGWRLLR